MDAYKSSTEEKRELPAVESLQEGQRQETALNRDEELSRNIPRGSREPATLERHKAEGGMHAVLSRAEEAVGCIVSEGVDSEPRSGSLFGKILVALDNSPFGRLLYEQALELAALHHSTLLLLHVFSYEDDEFQGFYPPASGSFYTFIGEQYVEAREQAHTRSIERMEALVNEAGATGVEAEFVLFVGSPERVIRRWAKEWGADLVIIGRRGYSGLSELFLGSVSNYVLHHVSCPVLVLQGERLDRKAQTPASSGILPAERVSAS